MGIEDAFRDHTLMLSIQSLLLEIEESIDGRLFGFPREAVFVAFGGVVSALVGWVLHRVTIGEERRRFDKINETKFFYQAERTSSALKGALRNYREITSTIQSLFDEKESADLTPQHPTVNLVSAIHPNTSDRTAISLDHNSMHFLVEAREIALCDELRTEITKYQNSVEHLERFQQARSEIIHNYDLDRAEKGLTPSELNVIHNKTTTRVAKFNERYAAAKLEIEQKYSSLVKASKKFADYLESHESIDFQVVSNELREELRKCST